MENKNISFYIDHYTSMILTFSYLIDFLNIVLYILRINYSYCKNNINIV